MAIMEKSSAGGSNVLVYRQASPPMITPTRKIQIERSSGSMQEEQEDKAAQLQKISKSLSNLN